MPAFIDLKGKLFGRLSVLYQAGRNPSGRLYWWCLCSCGEKAVVSGTDLRSGDSTSCGCFRSESISARRSTHRKSSTPTYRVWAWMIHRTSVRAGKDAEHYIARGITVCERWRSFENFLADMGERPEGMTLDRKNNDGNYEPGNCRWATVIQQQNNRRNNIIVELNGVQMTLAEAARAAGVNYYTLHAQVARGRSKCNVPGLIAKNTPVVASRK